MRKTKVRIVGDPDLVGQVHLSLKDHFKFDGDEKCFERAVGRSRYGKSRAVTVYITIKKSKEPDWKDKLRRFVKMIEPEDHQVENPHWFILRLNRWQKERLEELLKEASS